MKYLVLLGFLVGCQTSSRLNELENNVSILKYNAQQDENDIKNIKRSTEYLNEKRIELHSRVRYFQCLIDNPVGVLVDGLIVYDPNGNIYVIVQEGDRFKLIRDGEQVSPLMDKVEFRTIITKNHFASKKCDIY